MKKYFYTYYVYHIPSGANYYGVRSSKVKPELDTKYLGSGRKWKKFLDKAGKENTIKTIVEEFGSSEEATKSEFENMNLYKSIPNNMNVGCGGDGFQTLGTNRSEITKKRISEANSNPTNETRRKISKARRGINLPDKTKKKISETLTGRKVSIETRHKMSESQSGVKNSMFGKHHSTEARNKISEAHKGKNNNMFGKHHSIETRHKMSESQKGRKVQKGRVWVNNGEVCKFVFPNEIPNGFTKGRLSKK